MNDQLDGAATAAAEERLQRVLDRTTAAALAVSGAAAGRVCEDLVRSLASILGTDAALIGEFIDPGRTRMRTLAVWYDGRHLQNFEYDVANSPCRHIVGRDSRFVASGVRREFAPGTLFAEQGFDAYAGYSLFDVDDEQVGLIVALGRRPLHDPELTEALMKIFAVRAAAEMERRRAAAALQVSETSYRAIFQAAQDAMFVHDWDTGAIVDVNPRACEVYGYTRDEMLQASLADLSANVPPYTLSEAIAHIEAAKAGRTVRLEWHRRNKDGSLHWDEVVIQRVELGGVRRILAVTREVTERRRTEMALRDSEALYRGLFNASADAMVLRDADFRVVDVNPSYTTMSGYSREETIGADRLLTVGAAENAQWRAAHRRMLAGEQLRFEFSARRKDGAPYEAEVRGMPVSWNDRPHVLYVTRDITDRKRAERALAASEEQYRGIFNASADALVLWNSELTVVDVNPAYLRIYKQQREDVVGFGYPAHYPRAYVEQRQQLIRRALAGETCELQTQSYRPNGELFEVEWRVVPVLHRGEPHALAIARDITDRKRAEERLRASEEQYRAIFSASADAMVLRDENLRVVDVNPAFLALIQRPREEIIGRVQPAFVIAPERDVAEGMLHRAVAGQPGKLEVRTVGADGVEREVEVRAVPMQYQGRPHVLAIARDVTAERRAERERGRLEAQLRQAQKMEAIGQLTGGIAHDFNNILASVMGYVVLAEERASDRDDVKGVEYLGQALASCRRARDLIQQMLTFSRGGRGEPRAVDLGALVRETAPMLRASLPATLELALHCDQPVPPVWVDEVQAHQVLLNLAINARDATEGAGTVSIGVHRHETMVGACASCRHGFTGNFVELAVTDSGAGIAPELVERIFDPFFTSKAPGKGSGMGLSTVHGIVHEYGGHVVVDSKPGEGTAFRVLWPASTAVARANPVAERTAKRRERLAGSVLLVDDEPAVLGSMRETLLHWGLQVDAYTQPEAALAAFEAAPESFDVVVTDLAMPHLSGLELAARLQARRQLPILLVSGYIDERSLAAAHELGLRAPLRKPVEADLLWSAIETALGETVPSGAAWRRGDG